MTNAEWWSQVVASRTQSGDGLTIQPAWILHRDGYHAAVGIRQVAGVGSEIVLIVDGDWRRTRLYRTEQQAERDKAIADTRATFEAKGWR